MKKINLNPNLKIKRKKFYPTLIIFLFTITAGYFAYFNYYCLAEELKYEAPEIKIVIEEPKWLQAQLTMYNAGDPYQCDNTPCISSSGDNICQMLAQGENVCAANFLPIGTIIYVEGLGTCTVLDRMAIKYSTRIDWALQAHQYDEAVAWGIQTVNYRIIN